jgi:hypothetical protein
MNEIFLHDLKIIRLLNYFDRNVGLKEALNINKKLN